MRVLITEDDQIARRVLERTLTKWGHTVVATGDGAEAWQALQRDDAPKLAILDWMMPEMDGVEVCRRVRRLPAATPTYITNAPTGWIVWASPETCQGESPAHPLLNLLRQPPK